MYNPYSPNNIPPPGKPKKYTAEEFGAMVDQWIGEIHNATVDVEVDKVVQKDGKALVMKKPEIPHVWKFCMYAGIDKKTFYNYSKAPGYEAYFHYAHKVKEYCNERILDMMLLGQITDNAGKFYLVNNSEYVDKSEVVQIDASKPKPKWLQATPTLATEEQKALPHESIPFEEVKEQKK